MNTHINGYVLACDLTCDIFYSGWDGKNVDVTQKIITSQSKVARLRSRFLRCITQVHVFNRHMHVNLMMMMMMMMMMTILATMVMITAATMIMVMMMTMMAMVIIYIVLTGLEIATNMVANATV